MKTKKVVVGSLNTNCYIVEEQNNILVIDPGADFHKIKQEIENKKVVGIIITHYHFDHIGALYSLKNYTNAVVYDYTNLKEEKKFNIFFNHGMI